MSDLGRLRSVADGLTAARAGGATHASWFTSIQGALEYDAKTGFPNWGYTFATGVRNDVVVNSVTYTQDETCWPRASWYAFQRLAWLLGQAAERTDGSDRLGGIAPGPRCLNPAGGDFSHGTCLRLSMPATRPRWVRKPTERRMTWG